MSVWLNTASTKRDGMEEIKSMYANMQRENMIFSKPSWFCFLLIGMDLTHLLMQNAVAKSVYSESLGKCCSLSLSLTIVFWCLALEDDKPNGLLSVTVCSRTLLPLSLTLLISHRQFSFCLTHIYLDTGFHPMNKQGSIVLVPQILCFGETSGSAEQRELKACHLPDIAEYCVFHRKSNYKKGTPASN